MSKIHHTAVIEPGAEIGKGTEIGAFAVIGAEVRIGENNWIAPHTVISGRTKIGNSNKIFPFASIGMPPQDLKYHGEPSFLEIGDGNLIREYVTIQPGTEGGGMLTKVGNQNLFMAGAHVAHDVSMGDRCIMVNGAALAGHVKVGNHVIMGAHSGYHQFIRLGDYVIISGGSMVTMDIPPYCTAQGDRAGLVGINQVGLERNGFSAEDVRLIKNLYKEIFLDSGIFKTKVSQAQDKYKGNPSAERLFTFLTSSQRGITQPRKSTDG